MALRPRLLEPLRNHIQNRGIGADLLFATREGTPSSRNTFRNRV